MKFLGISTLSKTKTSVKSTISCISFQFTGITGTMIIIKRICITFYRRNLINKNILGLFFLSSSPFLLVLFPPADSSSFLNHLILSPSSVKVNGVCMSVCLYALSIHVSHFHSIYSFCLRFEIAQLKMFKVDGFIASFSY